MAVIKMIPEPIVNTRITRLAFLSRFTDDEAVAIDLASIDNPAGTSDERIGQASIRRYMSKINAASFVDVAREDTIIGVNVLETMGLIGAGRADEILSTEITSEETPL